MGFKFCRKCIISDRLSAADEQKEGLVGASGYTRPIVCFDAVSSDICVRRLSSSHGLYGGVVSLLHLFLQVFRGRQ